MLNVEKFKEQLKEAMTNSIIPAIKEMELTRQSRKSKAGTEEASQIASVFEELVIDPLADNLATAIDAYIKNISITGTIVTSGSPVTQTANVISMKTPISNGKVINTLGIS